MSRPIRVTRRCAAPCLIEFAPSPRLAAAWLLWLAAVSGIVLFAVAIPWLARIALCLALATLNVRSAGRAVLLRGDRSVRRLQWSDGDEFTVWSEAGQLQSALLASGSFRLGALLVLRFETDSGVRTVLVDGARQETHGFRRLCRRLEKRQNRGSGRSRERN